MDDNCILKTDGGILLMKIVSVSERYLKKTDGFK